MEGRAGFGRKASRWAMLAVLGLTLLWAVAVSAGTNTWTTGGPVGGNTIVSMAADPGNANTLYASILYGPLYKTTDGGANWSQLSLSVPAWNSVGAIAVDPTNSSVVYAAWYGVAKSTNGGANWSGFNNPAAYINTIVIDPTNSSTLYGGGRGYGIYKSTDGGSTWNTATTGLTNNQVTVLVMAPGSPQTLFAATDGGGVFKSTDGAGTWTAVNTGLGNLNVRGLAIDSGTGTLYAGTWGGGVYTSVNGGTSWTQAGLAGQSATPLVADAFGDLYAADYSGNLWVGTNGGSIWTLINSGLGGNEVNAIAPSPAASGALHVGTTSGGIYGTTNGGTTWTAQNLGLGSHLTVYSQAVDPASPSTLYAGSGDGLYKSTDSGATWSKVAFAGSTVNSVIADASVSPTRLYTAVWGPGVDVSTDGGTTWTNINNGALLANILCVGQDPANPPILYAGTSGDGLFKSTNGGSSWTNVAGGTGGLPSGSNYCCLAFDPNHSGTVYVGLQFSDVIYKTTDGGTTWTSVYSGPDYGIYNIAVAPYDSNTVYAASYGNTNGVVKSTDGGATWTAVNSGLSCMGVYAVALDPVTPGMVYIGVGGCSYYPTGVYKSLDGGTSWTAINSGLSNTMVHAIMVDPTNRTHLLAGTEAGVFTMTQVVGPTVTGIAPTSGPTTGGTSITITGSGFTGALAVSFGGTAAVSFSVVSDTQITAVSPPRAAGTVDITVTCIFGASAVSQADQFTYACPTITVGPASLPNGVVGEPYSQTVTASGGATPYGFAVSAGSLPTGLSLDSTTGALTGNLTGAGSFTFTITATDANGCAGATAYSVVVTSCPTITVSPASLSSGTAGVAYSQTFTQTNGQGAITWSESGTLPAGLTFNASTATLSGTPGQTGSFPITVTATDKYGCTGSQSYTLIIVCPTITVSPASLSSGTTGVAYSQTFTQTGGIGTITWSESGTLPTGMSFTAGMLSGTPTQTGSFPITVTATDSDNCTGSQSYTLNVVCPTITVTSSPTPVPASGAVGDAYGPVTFSATGSSATYRFSSSGTLPPGLTLTDNGSGTATLSGIPTAAGTYVFSVVATDAYGCSGSLSVNVFISLYNTSILDDLEKSEMCANSHTGAWSYTILKGPDAGATFTGTGILESGNGYFRINSPPGSVANVKLTYYYLHGASATFSDGAAGVSSSLNDHYTQDDPPICTTPPPVG